MSFALIPKQFESFPVNLSWIKYFHYIVHYWWDFTVGVGSKNDIINAKTKNSSTNLGCLIPVRILCSWDRASQLYVNKCPTRSNYTRFILSANCCIYVGWSLHPSSGAQIAVSTASGTSQPLLLPVANVEELRFNSSTIATCSNNNGWLVPDAVDTAICATDDGWRDHPKHVQHFADRINRV